MAQLPKIGDTFTRRYTPAFSLQYGAMTLLDGNPFENDKEGAFSNWLQVGPTFEVTATVTFDLTKSVKAAFDTQIQHARAEFAKRVTEINALQARYLAIENCVADTREA